MTISIPDLKFRPRLTILSPEQIKEIHWASLEVLERTGIIVSHPKALEYLDGAGCRVDGNRVRIPASLVEECLRRAPRRLTLGRRDGRREVFLQGGNSWFGPSLDCLDYLDPVRGRQPFKLEHCAFNARVAEALPNYTWAMVVGMASDQNPKLADRLIVKTALTNCDKPLVFCCNDVDALKAVHEMAITIAGSREKFQRAPFIVHYSEPISPLTYFGPAVEKVIYCCENRIPLIILSAPQAGGTSPASLAGTVVQGNAESLSGLVLSQVIAPGTPFVYGTQTTIMDMRTTIFTYGSAEQALMIGAVAQMAQFYDLPLFSTAGATDSKYIDPQAGIEATFQCLAAAATGSSLVHDCGSWMDHGSMASPEYMVMINDILAMVNQFMKGLEVNQDSLAVEAIDQVGPGGNYLQHPSTLKRFKDVYYSKLFDRSMAFKPDVPKFNERLRDLTLKYISREPAALPKEVIAELDTLEASWRKA